MRTVDGMTDTWRRRDQRSSQSSAATVNSGNSLHSKISSVPKGISSRTHPPHFLALQEVHKFHIFFLCTRKLSLLIKLIIIRNMSLRHKSHDTAMIQSCCHIIELASVTQRESHKDQGVRLPCLLRNMQKLIPRTVQKTSLEKKIVTGISCDTKFRKIPSA